MHRTAEPQDRSVRFEALFRAEYAAVAGYIGRRAEADFVDDLVDEVFLVAWRRLERVPAEPRTWLLTVARNVLGTHIRGARRSPDGHIVTAPIEYKTTPFKKTPARLDGAQAAALISVAHVGDEPGKEIFLQTGQISSGSLALAYSLHHGQLVASGAVLGYGGDGGTSANFQCLAGSPSRLVQHNYELI
jgi:hypothetical protein